jgi:predicted Zn-dependent protease
MLDDRSAPRTVTVDRSRPVRLTRRGLLQGLASGSVVALTGCVANPHLGGREQLMLVSDSQLAAMSGATWQQVTQQYRPVRRGHMAQAVDRVGHRIVGASGLDPNRNWQFTLLDSNEVNAFVLPGGQVAFFEGITQKFQNEDQMATVMGHEVGHVAGRHAAERASQQLVAGLGMTVAQVVIASSDTRYAAEIAGVLGAGVTFGYILPYSRQHEYEADALGLRYMARAGYQPRESVRFWQNMMGSGRQVTEFMSTHPSDRNRINALNQQIRSMG